MKAPRAVLLCILVAAMLVAALYVVTQRGSLPNELSQLLDGNFWSALFQRFYRGLYG